MENDDNRVLLACLLIEATGDSEEENLGSRHSDAAAGEDDAQSCIRSSSGGERKEDDDGDLSRADFGDGCGLREEEYGGGGSDLEDGVVDQCRGGGKETPAAAKRSDGRDVTAVSEREEDRLFWEACLASK